ncbi:hypothetical protein [Intestinibacter sp.]|uniref:hypothetical protein n=1 Tax=Intestinibacter sp. TaxID=1965304 RepID=UPI002A9181FE|nr:hypothetical protein [Intestinibacter sp.]MDY5213064.1 hypothetical protein [Intestinibacter sp.]
MDVTDVVFLNQTLEKCLNLIDNQRNILSEYEYSIVKKSLDNLRQEVEYCLSIDKID